MNQVLNAILPSRGRPFAKGSNRSILRTIVALRGYGHTVTLERRWVETSRGTRYRAAVVVLEVES